ncbi:toxin-antitoxin system YwqK family antitoxin [Fulvivirga sedimenti]|uniref:Toxin-antitoxin system YwqK family antitoxin n=1 Tax=Fulvivirga sedimenti TaxID=2879465 RepID=A0A9X1L122_9BACT|nr:hypothetical protein [Fulvivirga sedimenti]MCA6078469.1 hypothetical protein [Fulvivirga sedimenti]
MKRFVAIIFIFCTANAFAQSDGRDPSSKDEYFSINPPATVNLSTDEEKKDDGFIEVPEKKRKKKVFYGMKTKKKFTRDGDTYELFYVLKEFKLPDPYVRDIYWLDYKVNKIKSGGEIEPGDGAILHGPYKKVKDEQVIEEGIFYMGTKHGRWVSYNKQNVLIDKEKYYQGWPRESQVSYYDSERRKMKEIIPIEYGEKEGNYYYFYPNGKVAVRGEYHWDHPVGEWTEYYPSGFRKKIVRYDKDPFEDEFRPYIVKEWDPRGKVVYEDNKVQ